METMQRLTEITLGLWRNKLYSFDREYYEIGSEIYERDPERETPIHVSETRVARQASAYAVTEVADHFRCLRDSLQNILIDIDKCIRQRNLLMSDSFWRSFIVAAAGSSAAESHLWDFKETLEIWRIQDREAKRKACVKFAELVAGFANAEGGVLVVGVTDDRKIVGLPDLSRVESNLKYTLDVIARRVKSDRDIVRYKQVPVPASDGAPTTCLVVIVAQASDVVSVEEDERFTYPVRVGTGLSRRSRDEIAREKLSVKADNFDFVANELRQFVAESRHAS